MILLTRGMLVSAVDLRTARAAMHVVLRLPPASIGYRGALLIERL